MMHSKLHLESYYSDLTQGIFRRFIRNKRASLARAARLEDTAYSQSCPLGAWDIRETIRRFLVLYKYAELPIVCSNINEIRTVAEI